MTSSARRWLALAACIVAATAGSATLAYDAAADAQADLRQAMSAARARQVPVLLVFGANWCEDCRALDRALGSGRNGELIAREFSVVKVDVGNFDRNLDLAAAYGNPIKSGIPAAVVLSADGKLLYATRAGELADARRMSEGGIHDFFKGVSQTARGK